MDATASAQVAPLLSINDVARALNIGRRTLERMIASHEFPQPDRRIGRMPRWRRETLDTWIAGEGRFK